MREALNARQAYAENYNLAIQREIVRGATIEVDYIGTSGHRLGLEVDQNQPTVIVNNPAVRGSQAPNVQTFPYANWAQVITGVFNGKSNYNGLVISAKVNLRAHLTMNTSYTWSHSIDDTSSFLGTTFDSATPANSNAPLSAQRGNSAFDQRQRFINAFAYDLPFRFSSRLVNEAIGGWTVSGITNLNTGQPFTVLTNTNLDYSGFNQFLDRPNYICNGPLQLSEGTRLNLFNPACFTPNGPGSIGSTPRNAFYGPRPADRFRHQRRQKIQYHGARCAGFPRGCFQRHEPHELPDDYRQPHRSEQYVRADQRRGGELGRQQWRSSSNSGNRANFVLKERVMRTVLAFLVPVGVEVVVGLVAAGVAAGCPR